MAKDKLNDFKEITALLKDIKAAGIKDKEIQTFESLAQGLNAFALLNWAKLTSNLSSMTKLSTSIPGVNAAFKAMGAAIRPLGSAGITTAARNLGTLAESLMSFAEIKRIDWKSLSVGLQALTGLTGRITAAKGAFSALADSLSSFGTKKASTAAQAFGTLARSLKSFSELKWTGIIKGFLMMSTFGRLSSIAKSGFDSLIKSIDGFGKEQAAKAVESFGVFVTGLKDFAEISWARVTLGVMAMKILGPALSGLSSFAKSFQSVGKSLSSAGKILGEAISSFFQVLAGQLTNIAKGSLALGLISLGIAAFAESLTIFSKVDWGSVLKGLGVLALVTAGAMALGALMETGLLELGILAIAGLGLALIPYGIAALMAGKATEMLASAFTKIVDAIPKVVDPLIQLAKIGPALYLAAGGIAAVSLAMAGFALGQTGSAITGFFGKLIGGKGPIDQLKEIADMAPGLNSTANALERISQALQTMPSASGSGLMEARSENMTLAGMKGESQAQAMGGILDTSKTTKITSPVTNNVSSTVVNNGWMPDRSTALVLAPAF